VLKKQVYVEHKQSEIVPEYNSSLSCDSHLKLLFGLVCGMLMNRRGDESVYGHTHTHTHMTSHHFPAFYSQHASLTSHLRSLSGPSSTLTQVYIAAFFRAPAHWSLSITGQLILTNQRTAYLDQSQMAHQPSVLNKRGCTDLRNQSPLTRQRARSLRDTTMSVTHCTPGR